MKQILAAIGVLAALATTATAQSTFDPPDDNWWAYYNEEDAEMPAIRYAKTHDGRRKVCEDWFQYQYACWKGLKKAFDGLTVGGLTVVGWVWYNFRKSRKLY